MTHQVSVNSFRLGKTFLWKNNNLLTPLSGTNLINGNLNLTTGIERAIYYSLKNRRLYIVKGTVSWRKQRLHAKLLLMPRIKTKPRAGRLGDFAEYILLNTYNWNRYFYSGLKKYTHERVLKKYKFHKTQHDLHINKWLSRRMLRGSACSRFYSNQRYNKRYLRNQTNLIPYAMRKQPSLYLCAFRKQIKWKKQWWLSHCSKKSQVNGRQLSIEISQIIGQSISIHIINVFSYLIEKGLIHFKTHQEHFWNAKFRHNRYYYTNYYDLINSFLLLGILKNCECLMLDILRNMLETINKIKKFMFFVDAIVKNMKQIRTNYTCFRMTLTGKIGGGTRRTKTYTVGYGFVPVASLTIEALKSFMCYSHVYGSFGIKFIMCRAEGLISN